MSFASENLERMSSSFLSVGWIVGGSIVVVCFLFCFLLMVVNSAWSVWFSSFVVSVVILGSNRFGPFILKNLLLFRCF